MEICTIALCDAHMTDPFHIIQSNTLLALRLHTQAPMLSYLCVFNVRLFEEKKINPQKLYIHSDYLYLLAGCWYLSHSTDISYLMACMYAFKNPKVI